MKKIRIAIENPCHENWDKMTPESQGRFCHSCQKIVVDFSQMSDSEILQYFSTPKTEKICGRFKSEQLRYPSESTQPQKNWEQSKFPSASNSQPPLDWQHSKFQSPYSSMMPLYGQESILQPNANHQPPLQLLHFAYILILVLGIGVSSCNSETTKGEILMGDTTTVVDSPKEETTCIDTTIHSANNTHLTNPKVMDNNKGENPSLILGKPKIQHIEKVEPIIMGECIIPYEYDDKHEMQNKNLQDSVLHHSTLFTTGPYEHRLPTPYNTNISNPTSTNNR